MKSKVCEFLSGNLKRPESLFFDTPKLSVISHVFINNH